MSRIKTPEHTTPIGLRIPTDLLKRLDESAARNRRDRTGEILHALDLYLDGSHDEQQIIRILQAINQRTCKLPIDENSPHI